MTKVKICGVRTVTAALAVAEYGADYIGLVFAPSRRQVDIETATEIIKSVRARYPKVNFVGVFVNSPAKQVNRVADTCGLDSVQLSGDESWDYCLEIRKPVIKPIHITSDANENKIRARIEKGCLQLKGKTFRCLLDTQGDNLFGGTGRTFDWSKVKNLAAEYPLIIAGGLHPGNVSELISQVHPWGVDVSSGVETNGVKDINKIRAFISAVKESNGTTI